jgi:hypothetical protein
MSLTAPERRKTQFHQIFLEGPQFLLAKKEVLNEISGARLAFRKNALEVGIIAGYRFRGLMERPKGRQEGLEFSCRRHGIPTSNFYNRQILMESQKG